MTVGRVPIKGIHNLYKRDFNQILNFQYFVLFKKWIGMISVVSVSNYSY